MIESILYHRSIHTIYTRMGQSSQASLIHCLLSKTVIYLVQSIYYINVGRYMVAANSIVTLYSLFELGVSVWEMARNTTLFPEILQVWFDFGHDQVISL